MSSTLKDNPSRATIYMAFPKKRRESTSKFKSSSQLETGLGGLLEGVGPSLSDLSVSNLLRCLSSQP